MANRTTNIGVQVDYKEEQYLRTTNVGATLEYRHHQHLRTTNVGVMVEFAPLPEIFVSQSGAEAVWESTRDTNIFVSQIILESIWNPLIIPQIWMSQTISEVLWRDLTPELVVGQTVAEIWWKVLEGGRIYVYGVEFQAKPDGGAIYTGGHVQLGNIPTDGKIYIDGVDYGER